MTRPDATMMMGMFACWRTAGCPSAERKLLTTPTGGAAPGFALQGAETPLAQLRPPGRADLLKRRRKVRDEILGRVLILPLRQGEGWGEGTQSPSRKGRRQTLNRCLVQSAPRVDARFQKDSLAAVSRASSSKQDQKTDLIQSASGVRPLDFRDHIEVRRGTRTPLT